MSQLLEKKLWFLLSCGTLMTDNVIIVARHLTFGLTCSEHHTAPGMNQLLKFSAMIFVDITNFPVPQAATS
jgi:hypothetical protein